MTENVVGNAVIKASVDSTGVDAGVERVGKSLDGMAARAKAAAGQASQAVGSVGTGGEGAADKLDRTTQRIIGQIERVTAAARAGGRDTAAYFESIGQARGANLDALRPYLDQLKQAETLQRGAGVSAAQMANNLRMVGPQITDIVTQLAGGQAPLQVFIQQGGQLKDIFGGIAPAARALGTAVLGLINPITVSAAALVGLAAAYKLGADESVAFERALVMSGNSVGRTSGQLQDMAKSVSGIAGTQHNAAAAIAELSGSTRIAGDNLQSFATTAVLLDRTLGQTFAESRKQLEELAKSPAEASLKLNDQYNYLTAAVYRQIKALEESGRAGEAAALAQRAFFDEAASRAKTLDDQLGYIARTWRDIKGEVLGVVDAIAQIGRPSTTEAQINAIRQSIAAARAVQDRSSGGGLLDAGVSFLAGQRAQNLQGELDALERRLQRESEVVEAQEAGNRARKAGIEWERQLGELVDQDTKRENERYQIVIKGLAAGKDTVQINQALAQYEKLNAKKTSSGGKTLEQQQAEDYAKIIGELNQVQEKYRAEVENVSEAEKVLAKARNEGKLQDLPAEYRKVIEAKAADLEATRALQDAEKRRFDALVAQINVDVASAEKNADTNETLRKQLADLESSTKKLGATKRQLLEIEQQDIDLKIQSAEIDLKLAEIAGKSTIELQTQITLLRQLKDARTVAFDRQRYLDTEKAAEEAAKHEQEAFKKSAEEINRGLTDSLFRAAESGKNVFETLRTSIEGMFNNLVLKPVVKAIFDPISGEIATIVNGVVGGVKTAAAGSSGLQSLGNFGGALSGGSKILSWLGTGGSGLSIYSLGSTLALPSIGAGALGSGLITSSGSGILLGSGTGLSAAAAGGGTGLSLAAGGASIGGGALGSGITAGAGTAAGAGSATGLAAIPGWGWAAAAAVLAASLLGGGGGAPKGGGSVTFGSSGLMPDATRLFGPNSADELLTNATSNLYSTFKTVAEQFGGSADKIRIALGFDTDPGGKASNRIASYVETALGQVPFLQAGRDVGRDEATLKSELQIEGSRVMLAALQNADLKQGFNDIFSRLDPATASPDAIESLLQLAATLRDVGENAKQLPGVMGSVAELSATAREALVGFAGGLDAFVQNQAGYYQNFYSVQERASQSQKNLTTAFQSLGIAFEQVDTRGEFRNLVEGLDLTDTAQAALYGGLLKLQQPLSEWITATDELAKSSKDAADALTRQNLETRRGDLNTQISDLTATYGDLSKSLDALENPARTVAQRFLDLGQEIGNLDTEMRRILGTAGVSLTDQLSAAVNSRAGVFGAQLSLQDTRNSTIVQQFLDGGDKQGAVDFLTTMFDYLIAAIPTADNPGDFANRAASVLTQRENIRASITTESAQTELDLTRTARELRITGLETEIENLRTMAGVADDISRTLVDLRTGSLSALSPTDQLAVARTNFDAILAGARGGDVKALQQLTGAGTGLLTEAQSFFASGGDYAGTFDQVTNALDAVGMQLANVPTQLSVAQESLTALQGTKDAAVTTATNSGNILTGLTTIDTALGTALTNKDSTLVTLTTAINAQITAWNIERDALRAEFDTVRDAYRELVDDLETVTGDLSRLAGNANLAAAAAA